MTEWLNEGDTVITAIQFKLFKELLDFVKEEDVRARLEEWRKQRVGNKNVNKD